MSSTADIADFYVDVENNTIVQMRVATKYFNIMKAVPGSYRITIKRGKRRSNKSNAYYWAVVIEFVYNALKDAGFDAIRTKDDAHEVCKTLFLKTVEEHNGLKIEKVGSTKKLTTKEFEEYIQHICIWCYDYLSTVIPAPNSQAAIDYYD